MVDVNFRLRTLDDDARIVAIRNEANPHFPPMSVGEYRYQADPANQSPNAREVRYVADMDHYVVGLYLLASMTWVKRPGTHFGSIGVDAQYRRRGIGGALYDHMMQLATEWGAKRMYGNVSEDDEHARRFIEKRGFAYTGRQERLSRLDVHAANLAGYEGAVERLAEQGLKVTTLAEVGVDNEDFMRALHHMQFQSALDIPSSEEWEEPPFETWRKWTLEAPGRSPERVFLALDGDRPVGVASLDRRGENAGFNGYTGVDRAYRGKGVARALKLRTIEWSRENGIDCIFTGNDVDNKRMLDINIRLGYKPVPSGLEIVKELAGAEAS